MVFDPQSYQAGVPYQALAALRRTSPVCWIEEAEVLGWPAGPGYWAVFRHADVKAVLRDSKRFSSWVGATQIRDPDSAEDLAYVRRMMLNMDPPDHTRLRTLVASAFTRQAVTALDVATRRRAADLVDAVQDREEFDFVDDLSADLPLATLAEVMGVPDSDRYLLHDWSNRVIGYQDDEYSLGVAVDPSPATTMAQASTALRPTPDAAGRMPNPRSRAGMPDLYAYAHELARYKRDHLGTDVMSMVLRARDDGRAVTDEEFENLFWLFSVAGNETLRNGIPGGMLCLLQHPDQYRRLRHDPTLVGSAVEEMLRFWPPVIHFRRTATEDCQLGGERIGSGDKVVVYHASANRDESVFDDPDRFDVARSPNDHLSFGFGVHFCIGAHLARLQMRALFSEVVTRLPELRLAGAVSHLTSNFQNGLKHLPVRVAR